MSRFYIGVGYAVNRELHSKDATYHDFTRRKGGRGSGTLFPKYKNNKYVKKGWNFHPFLVCKFESR